MGRASPILQSFNAGEFSPRLEGRTDIAKYASAGKIIEGFIPLLQGPAQRRGGFRYVAEIKDSTKRSWLVKFEFNTQQAYQLEFGDRYIRFHANHAPVVVSGVAAWVTTTVYAAGDLVLQGGVNYYCKVAHTAGTFATDLAAGDWYALTGNIYEIPSPYAGADLTDTDGSFRLRFVESADVIYFAHGSYAPRKLSRLGATDFVLSTVMPAGGPFKDDNITATTVYASAQTGAVTLTASSAIFLPQHVGSLFWLGQKSVLNVKTWESGKSISIGDRRHSDGKNYVALNTASTGGNKPTHTSGALYDGDSGVQWQYEDPGFGNVLITGYSSPTVVTGTVVSPFPSNSSSGLPFYAVLVANASTNWALPAWSDADGWPTQVTFYRSRLAFGRKQRVWLSVAGDYETFTALDQSALVTDDMAITKDLQSSKVNDMQWMEAQSSSIDALVIGTAGSEFVIKSMTENQPFGTTNSTEAMISTLGSRSCQPVHVGNVLLFIQRAGSKLRDVSYDFFSNQFQSIDQSIMAEHIVRPGVVQIVYQQEPYSLIWGFRSDGTLVCMTYSREQYPDAPHGGWHRHPVGGSGIVESLSVSSAPDNSRDELWAIVQRTINGVTRRYVEYMEWERRPNDDPEDQFYVDAGFTLNNTINATLQPGAGATVAHNSNVPFTAGSGVFAPTDVGRQIVLRYSTADSEGALTFASAKATITTYGGSNSVLCAIDAAFPSLSLVAAGGWRMTVTTVSGLPHEGMTVDVLADGASHPQCVVSGGSITLQRPASKVQAGLSGSAKLQTMRLNVGAQDGTTQGKKARVNRAVLRLLETTSLRYGISFADMFDVDFRVALNRMDNPNPVFTGDTIVDWPGEYDTNPWLCFDVAQPMAATIVAIMPQISASEQG